MQAFLPHRRFSRVAWDAAKFMALSAFLLYLLYRGGRALPYHFQWYRVPRYFFSFQDGALVWGPLMRGLGMTLAISAASFVLALVFGVSSAMLRLSGSAAGGALSRLYVESIRNTPLLTQILFLYFVIGPLFALSRYVCAILALALFEGAYASEIIRAGVLSVDPGQWEACHSLGLSRWQAYTRVVLPQAFRKVLPPLTGQTVSLVKDSALVSVIAVYDLAMAAQDLVADTFLAFEIWFAAAGLYLALTLSLSALSGAVERRMANRYSF
ncbi:MAG: amino acid ABC transporter permease [Thermodesulfobacteriota bacterium]